MSSMNTSTAPRYSTCDIHKQQIKYFCAAEACYYLPLCDLCCQEHQEQHNRLQLIPMKKALLMAESNLRRQENQIERYLNPLKTRQSMLKTVEKQKEDLEKEKERLIQFVIDKIDSEIKLLQSSNEGQLSREEVNIKKTLQFKMHDIYGLGSPHFDGKVTSIRKALNFETNHFMEEVVAKHSHAIGNNKLLLNRLHKFKVYQSTHHEIMLSPLDMRERAQEKTRQIKRVMNESPLYFLIDQNSNTSNLLYSLSPEAKKMFIYNIGHDDWTANHVATQIAKQGAAVHDHKRNRFFWIGGIEEGEFRNVSQGYAPIKHGQDSSVRLQPGRPNQSSYGRQSGRLSNISGESFLSQQMDGPMKRTGTQRQNQGQGYNSSKLSSGRRSDKILVYESDNKEHPWHFLECRLSVPRSSCQAVLIEDPLDSNNYGIVIAGGLGPNGQVLKSSQFLDLNTQSITLLPDTNFGAFSGTLVTYNKTNVLRIGGLYQNKNDIAVIQTVERLDCSDWLHSRQNFPHWGYVQLLVPEMDRFSSTTLFNANQGAIQINPHEIFVFGGTSSGMKGVSDSFIIGVEEFDIESRGLRVDPRSVSAKNSGISNRSGSQVSGTFKGSKTIKQYKFTVRWANEKPLISGDDFSGQCPVLWKGKMHVLQNMGSNEMSLAQKRLLCFNMYEWSQIEQALPQ